MGTWVVIALLAGTAVFFGWNRKTENKKGQVEYRSWPQLATLALTLSLFLVVTQLLDVPWYGSLAFWVLWIIAALTVASTKLSPEKGMYTGFGLFAAAMLIAVPFSSLPSGQHTANQAAQQVLTVRDRSGDVSSHDYHDNSSQPGASSDKPVSGDDTVNAAYAAPSLKCGDVDMVSWSNLVKCVNDAPKAQKDAYIAYFNSHASELHGNWDDVLKLAEAEKTNGYDTRVILVLNADVSNAQARQMAHAAAGDAATQLPIERTNGAIINTRGGIGSTLQEWADARSQVRVLLTIPDEDTMAPVVYTTSADVTLVGNTKAAKAGYGVEVECTNVTTGIVPKPHPQPKPTPTPTHPQPTPSTTPPTETPTPTPSTTPPTTPPSETPSCPPDSNKPECAPKGDVPYPTDKPPVSSPSGSPESTPPVESHPADPTDKPGDPIHPSDSVTAPGATQEPDPGPTPDPIDTGAPEPSNGGTTIPNPDGTSSSTTSESNDTEDAPATEQSTPQPTGDEQEGSQTPPAAPTGSAEDTPPLEGNALGGLFALPLLGLLKFRSPAKRRR